MEDLGSKIYFNGFWVIQPEDLNGNTEFCSKCTAQRGDMFGGRRNLN